MIISTSRGLLRYVRATWEATNKLPCIFGHFLENPLRAAVTRCHFVSSFHVDKQSRCLTEKGGKFGYIMKRKCCFCLFGLACQGLRVSWCRGGGIRRVLFRVRVGLCLLKLEPPQLRQESLCCCTMYYDKMRLGVRFHYGHYHSMSVTCGEFSF